jgi:hypothetical protein
MSDNDKSIVETPMITQEDVQEIVDDLIDHIVSTVDEVTDKFALDVSQERRAAIMCFGLAFLGELADQLCEAAGLALTSDGFGRDAVYGHLLELEFELGSVE